MIHNILKSISPSSSRGEASPANTDIPVQTPGGGRRGAHVMAESLTEMSGTDRRPGGAQAPQADGNRLSAGCQADVCPTASFSIDNIISEAYSAYPEASRRPVIGITSNVSGEDYAHRQAYFSQVTEAGGLPVMLCPTDSVGQCAALLDIVDGIILTGGSDHNPLWMGEEPVRGLGSINPPRDRFELILSRLAYNRNIPVLGICRGIQTLAIAFGGHVAQDISSRIKHSQDAPKHEPSHSIVTEPAGEGDGSVYGTLGNGVRPSRLFPRYVNSFHHQAVDDAGPLFRVAARSADGIVEAMECVSGHSILGVQWHPEQMGREGLPVFQWLVSEARLFSASKALHRRIMTVDSHCDTPMFFAQGVDFLKRDSRILYDLHKMDEGRIDAVQMVCYLPQPKLGQRFSECVDYPVDGPTAYADLIFNKIEDICRRASTHLSIARTPADIYRDKRSGRHSIILGIENGIALGHDLRQLQHFRQRGVTYITLCHNGDNDICDSARGCQTHGGVSAFGRDVIREMNRLGIMVDMSHAAETSFYQALELSSTPVVCSHSCCRALCDHPRNLTDDQMRALAAAGGVMQITLYHGFLAPEGEEATIDTFFRHLYHAIDVMGIDHVGIGTDFDGDGGVKGLASASELLNITRHLLRYNMPESDIEKLWGKNWLRVMTLCQAAENKQ
ncbi:MAG: membrane dipeptidase [Prevotella sp.]